MTSVSAVVLTPQVSIPFWQVSKTQPTAGRLSGPALKSHQNKIEFIEKTKRVRLELLMGGHMLVK